MIIDSILANFFYPKFDDLSIVISTFDFLVILIKLFWISEICFKIWNDLSISDLLYNRLILQIIY